MRMWWVACLSAGCLYEGRLLDDPDAAPPDGSESSRVTDGLIGLWTFDETAGAIINESSGLAPVNLAIQDSTSVTWADGALAIAAPVDINSGFGVFNRLIPACKATDQVTVEAWVTPASTTQTGTTGGQPARVMTLTVMNISTHLIGLGQLGETWAGQVRTSAAGLDAHGGNPMLTNGLVASTLTHLVLTSTATERRLYVDGVVVTDPMGGTLDLWENTRSLAVAGDPNERNAWLGKIHLAAVYERALSDAEVAKNKAAGPEP